MISFGILLISCAIPEIFHAALGLCSVIKRRWHFTIAIVSFSIRYSILFVLVFGGQS